MKTLALIAITSALASAASPLNFGVEVSGVMSIPNTSAAPLLNLENSSLSTTDTSSQTSSSITLNGKNGFGVKIAAKARYNIDDRLGIIGTIGYMYTTFGAEFPITAAGNDTESINVTPEATIKTHFITSGLDVSYSILPKLDLIGGLGVDIPVYSSTDLSMGVSTKGANIDGSDIGGIIQSSHFINIGTDYKANENLLASIRFKIPTSEFIDLIIAKYSLYQITAGATYMF